MPAVLLREPPSLHRKADATMQRSSDIIGYSLRATDGPIGTIRDLLFDERHYGLRWIVVDTGTWLPGREVLLPPSALGAPDPAVREYPVDLSRDKIKAAPGLETDEPVSRQLEADIYSHYAWNPYWFGSYGYPIASGVLPVDAGFGAPAAGMAETERPEEGSDGDPGLRSTGEVTGYYVEASDGSIGHVEDFIVDETEWAIRYLMIDTRNWWPGKKVLIAPDWLRDIDWSERTAFADATRDKIKAAPNFDPSMTLDRDYEERLFAHHGYGPYSA